MIVINNSNGIKSSELTISFFSIESLTSIIEFLIFYLHCYT